MPGKTTYGDFLVWKQQNARIWDKVEEFALQAADRRHRFGIKAVFERVRWWSLVETRDNEGFKINNNYAPAAARYLEEKYPHTQGLFAKRSARCDDRDLFDLVGM